MKIKALLSCVALALLAVPSLRAATPEEEKAFVEKFKAAYEKGDEATLHSLLYTKDANPMALEFYKMMLANAEGAKITSIELVALTPDEVKKASAVEEGPDGKKAQLPLPPTKKLKISTELKNETGSSTSSSANFVAEHEGKLVIPVPATVK